MFIANLGIIAGVYLGKQFFAKRNKKSKALKPQNRDLHYAKVSTASAALTTASALIAPQLTLVNVVALSYVTHPMINNTLSDLQKKQLKNNSVSTFLNIAMIVTGNYFAAVVHSAIYYFSNHFVIKNKQQSKQLTQQAYQQTHEKVWLSTNGIERHVPLTDVRQGDLVIVSAGETIPVDGMIHAGTALIDQQALTGEAKPIERLAGDTVMAATILLSGRLIIKTSHDGDETQAKRLNTLLADTQDYKTQLQLKGEAWSDKIAVPLMLSSIAIAPFAGTTAALTLLAGVPLNTVRSMLSVQTSAHLQWITEQGVLIKDGRVLEELPNIDVVLFDKTGTLTESQPEVTRIIACGEFDAEQLLTFAAAAEYHMEHPIAKAIVEHAAEFELDLPTASDNHYDLGLGVTVTINKHLVQVGSQRFIQETTRSFLPLSLQQAMNEAEGNTFVLIAIDNKIQGALELHPRLRLEVPALIQNLRDRGIKQLAIVSGDQQQPTERLANVLGLDAAYGEVLPHEKAELVKRLQDEGHHVCFVGDGLNDAIAMKQANVSVCPNSASAVTADAAQMILLNDDLNALNHAFEMSAHLKQKLGTSLNLWVGFGALNTLAVPLIALNPFQSAILYTGAYSLGLRLSRSVPNSH